MIRFVILFVVVYVLYRSIKAWMFPAASSSESVSGQTTAEIDDVMIKDPFCEAYFPKRNGVHLTFGGKGSYKISLFNKLSVNLWGNAILTPKNKEINFSLPLNVGADIALGKPNNDSLYAEIKIEYRDKALLKYRTTGMEIKDFIAPAQTSAYLFLKMPFHFPLFREHLHTNFQIGAGPIRFSREQRFIEHPRGSLIGPTVSFGVNGFIN